MARGPLVLDAAMGTRLIARGLDLSGDDPALWNLSHPDVVRELHARDVAAGSDAVVTNTFGANRRWLARYGRAGEVAAINRRAVELAREAAGPGRFVFGSIGPTASESPRRLLASRRRPWPIPASTPSSSRRITLEQAERALEQVGGTVSLPMLVCLLDWPRSPAEPARRLADLGAAALGANCQPGMEPALRLAEALHRATDLPLIFKPGAGLPGEPPASPESFARAVSDARGAGGPADRRLLRDDRGPRGRAPLGLPTEESPAPFRRLWPSVRRGPTP